MNRSAVRPHPHPSPDELERGAQAEAACPLDVALAPVLKTKPAELGFGTVFTDHMLLADYEPSRGLGGAHPALRAAGARPGDRGAALRAERVRGAEGVSRR